MVVKSFFIALEDLIPFGENYMLAVTSFYKVNSADRLPQPCQRQGLFVKELDILVTVEE